MGTVNFKKIMIATDGSTCSGLATEKGIEFARLSGGTVYAVYVVSSASLFSMNQGYSYSIGMNPDFASMYKEMHEAMEKHGHQALNYVKGLGEMKGVNVESVLLDGNPSDELIRYAEEEKWILLLWAPSEKQDWIGFYWEALQEIWFVTPRFLF
jgi:nucleotide-binding universal stress UspA family protein